MGWGVPEKGHNQKCPGEGLWLGRQGTMRRTIRTMGIMERVGAGDYRHPIPERTTMGSLIILEKDDSEGPQASFRRTLMGTPAILEDHNRDIMEHSGERS